MNRNDKFKEAASAYLERKISLCEEERRLNECRDTVSAQRGNLEDCRKALSEFVGRNVTERCAVLDGGRVVVIRYVDNSAPSVKIFGPDGEEIR